MSGLLLDTHTLIWMAEDDKRLGKKARQLISQAHADGTLHVSAISFWEIGMLIAKQKISLPRPPDFWRVDILNAGVLEVGISGEMAVLSTQLDWQHQDPADRIICATAMLQGMHVLTADQIILGWKQLPNTLNAKA